MRKHELGDEHWALVKDLFPKRKRLGRPPSDNRKMLSGMLWLLRAGAPWRDLPERFGPWSTVYIRFRSWRESEVLDEVVARLQKSLNDAGRIDWSLWCIDGSSIRASRAASGATVAGGATKSPKTTHSGARVGATGRRSTSSAMAVECRSR